MYKIVVIGHFGLGHQLLNGQTIKTKVISEELETLYGRDSLLFYDTHGGYAFLVRMPLGLLMKFYKSKNIVIMPGDKGLLLMLPWIVLYQTLFRRKVFYVVIGRWLPCFLRKWSIYVKLLKFIDGIFLETESLRKELCQMGFCNTFLMPNCKQMTILEHPYNRNGTDLRLCIFSRVMKEKGIAIAIDAVNEANRRIGHSVFSLDIYGQIWEGQEEWFESLMSNQPKHIRYCGYVAFNDSVEVLKSYFALLFPTYYHGECFAGTIIDAFAAGLPVLASDWNDNQNIVKDGVTGYLFPSKSVEALVRVLIKIYQSPDSVDNMREACLVEARKYQPKVVLSVLTSKFV